MNVLIVHNRYKEAGGEDRVVALETALLERHGHRVAHYLVDNHDVDDLSRAALAGLTVWNNASYRKVRRLLAQTEADVMHVHNTLPLASPAVYYAAAAEGVPVVQTLHNYRLICPNALCLRDGAPCTACVGAAVPVQAVRHACYRDSRSATAAVAAMVSLHRAAGTWRNRIDTYIAPTAFAREMFVTGGLPAGRIVVKPHFVDPDPGTGPGAGGYAVFVGRLSKEKGVETLLRAWSGLGGRVPLTIVGDGPLSAQVAAAAAQIPGITWAGRRDPAAVQALIGNAAMLVMPSLAYETFGQVVIEAYAAGTPVVVAQGGAAAELVEEHTGVHFRSGDAEDLAAQVERLVADPMGLQAMRTAARAAYERRYTGSASYQALLGIYDRAITRASRSPRGMRRAMRRAEWLTPTEVPGP